MITLHKNGITKKVAEGYSWKSLFFGVLYPAYRGDFKGFVIQFVLAMITFGLSWLFVPFFYNKTYLNRCVDNGWGTIDFKGI